MDEILKLLADAGVTLTEEELQAKLSPKPSSKKVLSTEQLRSALETKGLNKKGLLLDIKDDGSVVGTLPFGFVDVKAVSETEESGSARDKYLASAKDMEALKKIAPALADYKVYCFSVQAADSDVDRGYEHFTEKALQEMAALAVKNRIPYLITSKNNMCGDHDWKLSNTYGKVFSASVEARKGGGFNLLYKIYIPETDMTKDVLDGVFTALYDKVSVGFSLAYEDFTCDLCTKKTSIFDDTCPHMPGHLYDGQTCTASINGVNDNFEFSGVAVPMQPKAHVRLSVDQESDISAKFLNSKTFEKGGLVQELPLDLVKDALSSIKAEEKPVDRIINDVDTTKDNRPMDEETKAVKTPEVAEVTTEAEDLVVTENCKSRVEGMIEKATSPLLAKLEAIESKSVDLSEVLNSIKSLKEGMEAELTKVLAEVASIKDQVEKTKVALDAAKNLAVASVERIIEPAKTVEEKSDAHKIMSMFGQD